MLMKWIVYMSAIVSFQVFAETKKNVLVVMTDDLSKELFDDMLKNNLVPNINNHIIKRGVYFKNSFVTNPVCCPSRANYLTGQYSKNNGVLDVGTGYLYWMDKRSPAYGGEDNTIATWMHKKGYYTGHVGKYLNGYGMATYKLLGTLKHVPKGYDAWYGLLDPTTYNTFNFVMIEKSNPIDKVDAVYYPKTSATTMEKDSPFTYNLFKDSKETFLVNIPVKYDSKKQDLIVENYQTDIIAQKAIAFMNDREKTKPFFLSIMPMAPHIELNQVDIENSKTMGYKSHFREKITPAPRHREQTTLLPSPLERLQQKDSFNEADISDKPKFVRNKNVLDGSDLFAVEDQYRHMMGSMIAVDDMVGAVVAELKKQNLYDDTLIIFTSDNGYMYGEHRLSSKVFAYDESSRVPLVVAGGKSKGVDSHALIINNDLAPTIADVGAATPERVMDGRSFKALVDDSSAEWSRKQFLIEHYLDFESIVYINDIPIVGRWIINNGARRRNLEAGSRMLDLTPNDYKAIRRISREEDTLYIESYSKKLFNKKFSDVRSEKAPKPQFIEYYNLKKDPHQSSNIVTSSPEASGNWKKSSRGKQYDSLIDDFVSCKGLSCQSLENR